jgi:predicted enzyme related to lactoylglutathione lyase
MAKRKTRTAARKAKASSRPVKRPAAPARRAAGSARKHEPTKGLYGWITHTDLASNDPSATKAWAGKVLGWTFKPPFPTPNGDVHLFVYSDKGGGAIRRNNPPEIPGSIPYIHVADCQTAYDKALREGAEEMLSPIRVMDGVTVAIVRAPGGVPIGFSGP